MTSRADRRAATLTAIRQAAREILVAEGVQAVGLRTVARRLGLTAPALYRYVSGPDDLIRLVAEDSVVEATATVQAAAMNVTPSDEEPTAALQAASWAFRRWALDHPAEFGALFANPQVSADLATREPFIAAFGRLFEQLWSVRPFPIPDPDQIRVPLHDANLNLPPGARYVFLWCWSRLYGAVCLEVFGQLDWIVGDGEAMFGQTVSEIGARLAPTATDENGTHQA